jgi:hypothetical protein
MNNNDLDLKKNDLLTDDELGKLGGGINILSENAPVLPGLQGWSHCCNTTEPPTQSTEVK